MASRYPIRYSPFAGRRSEPTREACPMNINVPPPAGAVQWEQVRTRLDQNGPFSNMYDTPLYRDAVWEQFSREEYARRYAALRAKMRAHDRDVAIVPGG